MMLDAGFRSVWLIQPHLRFLISVSIRVVSSCPTVVRLRQLEQSYVRRKEQLVKFLPDVEKAGELVC